MQAGLVTQPFSFRDVFTALTELHSRVAEEVVDAEKLQKNSVIGVDFLCLEKSVTEAGVSAVE